MAYVATYSQYLFGVDSADTLEDLSIPTIELASPPQPSTSNILLGKENLYPAAQVTMGDAIATLFVFYLTHHMSKSTFQDLLDILQVLLPSGNLLPKKIDFPQPLQYRRIHPEKVLRICCNTCQHLSPDVA